MKKVNMFYCHLALASFVSLHVAFANEGIEVTGKGAVNAIPDKFSVYR